MTTFFCKPVGHTGHGHERMGHHGKAAPQVKLTFSPTGPPTLDPVPAPAKTRHNRNSWSGQMWSNLTSMFTWQGPVCWVNPQLVKECHPPPMTHYNSPPLHQYSTPPPVMNGGGLWYAAPPGNQQQQMMMENPMLLLQRNLEEECLPLAKLDAGSYYQMAKTDANGFFPMAKGTNGYYPAAKMGTDCVFPTGKADASGLFFGAKGNADGYFPGHKTRTPGFPRTPDTHRQTHTTSQPSVNPPTAATTTATASKPLNPYAREWIPPGYMTSSPAPTSANITTAVPRAVKEEAVEIPNHHHSQHHHSQHHHQHHHTTPIIPYSNQDFSEITKEEVEQVRMKASTPPPPPLPLPPPPAMTLLPHPGLGPQCQPATTPNHQDNVNNLALLSSSAIPTGGWSAGSDVEGASRSASARKSSHSQGKSERGPSESAVMSPGAAITASPAVMGPRGVPPFSPQSPTSPGLSGSVASPDQQDQVCVQLPSPDCGKNARPVQAKSTPSSPRQDQQVCAKLPSSPDCVEGARLDLAKSDLHTSSRSQSPAQTSSSAPETGKSRPESQFASPASPESQSPPQTSSSASGVRLYSPECQTSHLPTLTSATLEQKGQDSEASVVCNLEVPVSAKEGSESAGNRDSAKKVPASPERTPSPSVSYARVVETVTPSPSPPPPPPPEQDRQKGVDQLLPKIFQRDRTPPRQPPTPPKAEAQRLPDPFRRPSKGQRIESRKFLQELRESGVSDADGDDSDVWCGSSPSSVMSSSSSSSLSSSSSSSSSDLSQSPKPLHLSSSSSSSFILPSSSPSSPSSSSLNLPASPSSPVPISPLRCVLPFLKSTPQSTPAPLRTPVTPNSPTDSLTRTRSESESSAASLDIDFVDEVDRIPTTPSSGGGSGTNAPRRPINRFLACILGSGDSESEDEEDWDDWDEVCVEEDANGTPHELDDSWETFGLEMVVLQCAKTDPATESQGEAARECHAEPEMRCRCEEVPVECRTGPKGHQTDTGGQCQTGVPPKCQACMIPLSRNVLPADCEAEDGRADDLSDASYLVEVNERWEREVGQVAPRRSPTRVTFGRAKIHPMVVWAHAYRQARRGPWEQQALDRSRFRQRIGTAEMALSWVLQPSHRTAVYERLNGPTTTTAATTSTTTS